MPNYELLRLKDKLYHTHPEHPKYRKLKWFIRVYEIHLNHGGRYYQLWDMRSELLTYGFYLQDFPKF